MKGSDVLIKGGMGDLRKGIVARFPVLISSKRINFTLKSRIKLMDDVSHIEWAKNRMIFKNINLSKEGDKLYIKGKIRKTLHYFNRYKRNDIYQENVKKHCIVYIPFEISSTINENVMASGNELFHCYPRSSKIVDSIRVVNDNSHKIIYDYMKITIELDIIQEKYIKIPPRD